MLALRLRRAEELPDAARLLASSARSAFTGSRDESESRRRIPYGTATSGCEQLPKVSRSSLVDGRILVENPVFKDRRDVAGGRPGSGRRG